MTSLPFGRVVTLVTDRAASETFRLGLEAIESGTGRLVADPFTDYDGEGIAFAKDDILFGKLRPYLAKAWLADGPGAAVGDFHVYRPDRSKALPRYLRWVVLARIFLDPVESSVFGAKMPRASWDFIKKVDVYLPPLAEQRAIADYLDRETAQIDELVAEQQVLIEMLDERRRTVIAHATTKGLDAGAPLVASGVEWLGDVPAAWKVRALRRCGTLLTGSTPPTADASNYADGPNQRPWVRPQDLSSETIASAWLTPEGWQHLRPVPAGCVLVGCIAYSLGSIGHLRVEATTNQQITSILPTEDSRYLYYVMLAAKEELWAASQMNRVPILNNERLGAIRVPVPPVEEQRLIAAYLDAQTQTIDRLKTEGMHVVELAQERRSALITAAVTGQIDVRGVG